MSVTYSVIIVKSDEIDVFPFVGHTKDCVDAVAVDGYLYSVGKDKVLHIWEERYAKLVGTVELEDIPKCVSVQSEDIAVVCGCVLYVVHRNSYEIISQNHLPKSDVDFMYHQSDSELIIQLSTDNYFKAECKNGYTIKGPFKGRRERVKQNLRISSNCIALDLKRSTSSKC